MNECIFCKLLADGSLKNRILYEDDEFVAFWDAAPLTKGHLLLIPRKHVQYIWDYDNLSMFFKTAKDMAQKLRGLLNTEKIDLLVSGGSVAHAHIHLIPDTSSGAWSETQEFLREKRKALTPEEREINSRLFP